MARPDPVKAALAQAQVEADALEQQTSSATEVATTTTASTAVAAVQPGQRRSLADLAANAAFAVDFYFGVDDLGLKIGKDKSRRDYMDVELKFGDMKGGWIIRANAPGTGVKYFQSYDGATEARSRQSWEQVVAKAQAMDGNAYVSDLIELPVTLLHDAKDMREGKPPKAGQRGGVSISYQNFKHFSGWFAEQYAKHGADAKLRVRLGYAPKVGSGNSEYGVYTWELLDEIEAQQAA